MYSGQVHFAEIAAAKNAVDIPVIANGGVFSKQDALTLIENTGADGIMVARAALFDPQVFCEITDIPKESRWEMFEKQLKWTGQVCNERFTTVFMRKMAAFYLKGQRGAAAFKDRLFKATTPSEVLEIAKEAF
jgi:tRNA-dihydrouridine synthase B